MVSRCSPQPFSRSMSTVFSDIAIMADWKLKDRSASLRSGSQIFTLRNPDTLSILCSTSQDSQQNITETPAHMSARGTRFLRHNKAQAWHR